MTSPRARKKRPPSLRLACHARGCAAARAAMRQAAAARLRVQQGAHMCPADRTARRQRPARVAPGVGDNDFRCVARRGGPIRCLSSFVQCCPACWAKLCALPRAARGAQHVQRGCDADEHGRRARLPRKRGAAPASRQPCAAAANAPALRPFAVDGGVNMFDSAEMYPVPQRAETQARRASAAAHAPAQRRLQLLCP